MTGPAVGFLFDHCPEDADGLGCEGCPVGGPDCSAVFTFDAAPVADALQLDRPWQWRLRLRAAAP